MPSVPSSLPTKFISNDFLLRRYQMIRIFFPPKNQNLCPLVDALVELLVRLAASKIFEYAQRNRLLTGIFEFIALWTENLTLWHTYRNPLFFAYLLSLFFWLLSTRKFKGRLYLYAIYLFIYFLGIGRSRISSLWGSVEDGRERSNHHVAHSYRRQHSLDGMGQLVAINVVALAFNFNLLLLDVESIKSCTSHQRHSRTKVFAIIRQSSRSGCLQWR